MTTLTVLTPGDGEQIGPDPQEARLLDLYAHAGFGNAWVRANMVSSLDGAAWGIDGDSGSVNNGADMRVFRVIRSVADIILVGTATAERDGYVERKFPDGLLQARADRGQGPLALGVVTTSGHLTPELLASPDLFVITADDREVIARLRDRLGEDRVISAGTGRVDVNRAADTLARRGMPRVLIEGGPRLLGHALHDGALDELCLTITPILVGGDADRAVSSPRWLQPPREPRLAHLLEWQGTLISRWVLNNA